MKKLLAVSIILATAFLTLAGCAESDVEGQNLQGSAIKVQRKNIEKDETTEITRKYPIAAKIDKQLVYEKSNINSLGLKCDSDNAEANNVLKAVEKNGIMQYNYTNSETSPVIIYKTENPNNLTTQQVKDLFKNCGTDKDNMPIKAEPEYILWGSLRCDKGTEGDKKRCNIFVDQLKSYLAAN